MKTEVQPKRGDKSVVIHFDGLAPDCVNALASNASGKLFLVRTDEMGDIPPKASFHRVTLWGARRWFKLVCSIAKDSERSIGFQGDPSFLCE